MAKLVIKNLVKRFGKTTAVNNLNLNIKEGELVVLLGPSGCGKTTTLRCIAGLETPDEGEIWIGDTLVNDLSPKDRNVAMVFQSYALYPHMTIYNNLAFPLKIGKVPRREIDVKVKKVAQMLDIGELLDRKPTQLSGGQQQRVALGAALVREPKIFLMDEPLSNIDAKLRVHMRAEIKKLQKDLGVTTIYVTHDQIEAMTMADRVALIIEGTLQQHGSPSDIYDHPTNTFVGTFLGSPPMNLIECSLIEMNGLLSLKFGGFVYKLNKNITGITEKKAEGSELVLGIRPEDLTLHLNQVEGSYEGKVSIIESLGRESVAYVGVGADILKIFVPKTLGSSVKVGDKVWVSFDEDEVHIFDKKSGKILI